MQKTNEISSGSLVLNFIALILGISLLSAIIYAVAFHVSDDRLDQALKYYKMGEQATSVAEREEAFNKALTLYTQISTDYPAPNGDGLIYYNIANSYFQLGQYPWAILYYYKSLKLNPGNDDSYRNLQVALRKLTLPQQDPESWLKKSLWFHYGLSVPQRFQLLASLLVAATLFASFYIWKGVNSLKVYSILAYVLAGIVLLSVLYSNFVEPMQGVVLRATGLYTDAGKQYAKVVENPLSPGLKINILLILDDGKWAKITTNTGLVGYIPTDRLGAI